MLVGRCPRQRELQIKETVPGVWKNSQTASVPGAWGTAESVGHELRGSRRQMTQGVMGYHESFVLR